MAVARIAYHTEETLIQAIHRLAESASVCRVAVAYCGEAAHRFFPDTPAARPEDLRVIVDASEPTVERGLTNPKGLIHVLGLTEKLRSLAGLHAKAFIFDQRAALVGSANMSAQSIEHQYQLALEIWDSRIVRQLVAWFDRELWKKARRLDAEAVRRLRRLWPTREATLPARRTKAKLPAWRGDAPQPPPGPSEFKVAVSKPELRRLLAEFRSNQCMYPGTDGKSCSQVAREVAKSYEDSGRRLRSLWRRRASWGKADLEELFEIAYTNGKAAWIRKPAFMRQSPATVVRSLHFLLEGHGDPYVRFEKVLANGSPYKLYGMGEVGIVFLMHLWAPGSFAVVNAPVNNALKALKVSFGRAASQQKGQAFKDRTAVVRHIAKVTGLNTFGLVDHFLDAIGKGHISRPRV